MADKNGFVWLATEAGLVRFDGNRFKMYDRSEAGLPVNRLFTVGLSADGKVFTSVQYLGYHYITPSNTLKSIAEQSLFPKEKAPPSMVTIAEQLRSGFVKRYKAGLVEGRAQPAWGNRRDSYFNTVIMAGDHYYYVNTNNEVMVADTAMQNFTVVSFTGSGPAWSKKLSTDSTPVYLINRDDEIFLRRADSMYRLDFSPDKKTAFATAVLFVGNIPNIMGLLQLPGAGTTIVATITDGIYVFRKQSFTTIQMNKRETNVFYAQAPYGNDGVITSKGVVMPDRFIPFSDNFFAYSILKTNRNTYYLNCRNIDTFTLRELGSQLEKVNEIPLTEGGIYCMRQLKNNSVWISASGKFMGRVDFGHIEWYDRPQGLPEDFLINTFIEASPGNFWIGGKLGLARFDVTTGKVQLIPGLKDAYVRSLYTDTAGVLWIGTYGSGFYALYKNRLIAFPVDANGYLKYVHSFMPDRAGRLWMSTNHGLFMFMLKDLYDYIQSKQQPPYYYYFDNTAGFLTNEFNGGCTPAGIVLGNGKFSYPSLNGLVQFYADSIQPVLPGAAIFVDEVVADTSDIRLTANSITIPHGINRLQFYISSPYFGNSYNQHIEYSLDESDKWYRVNDDYLIELSNVRKGDHSILLRKQAGFGKSGFITKQIAFTVEPAFYETGVFRLLLTAAILLMLYCLYRYRIKYLLRQKTWLEAQVAEKTKEQHALINRLETTVAELEQSKNDLQKTVLFRETLAMIVTHDLQSPLRFLSDAMERMHMIHKDADADTRELSGELKNTSANIHHFVEDFSIWIKKVNIAGNLDLQPVNVASLLGELQAFFSDMQKTNGNKIIAEASPAVHVYADYQLLKIILRNIIDNANKHTRNGVISVKLCTGNGMATITIADTGEGMKPEVLNKLIQRTKQQTFDYRREINGIGFGYRFVTDFCRMLHIIPGIKSKLAEGTTITLSNLKVI